MVQSVLNHRHVAQILSCSTGTVDNLVRRGELKYTRRCTGRAEEAEPHQTAAERAVRSTRRFKPTWKF